MRIRFPTPIARATIVTIALAFLIPIGCSRYQVPVAADEDEARRTLEQVLTAWRNGKPIEAMKQANPPIDVGESRWKSGEKLMKYEADGPGQPLGAERAFRVKLRLVDAKGKQIDDVAEYRVGTHPMPTVALLRSFH